MKTVATLSGVLFGLVLLTGCSDDNGNDGDHVWKEQTQTIDRAKEAEKMIMENAEEKRRAIEDIDKQ